MDIKRLFLAIIVSFVFMIAWTMFFGETEKEVFVSDELQALPNQSSSVELNPQQSIASALELLPGLSQNWKNEEKLLVVTALLSLYLGNGGSSIQSASIIEKINENSNELRHQGGWYAECSDKNFITQELCESYEHAWVRKPYARERAVNLLNGECNPCLKIHNDVVAFTHENT